MNMNSNNDDKSYSTPDFSPIYSNPLNHIFSFEKMQKDNSNSSKYEREPSLNYKDSDIEYMKKNSLLFQNKEINEKNHQIFFSSNSEKFVLPVGNDRIEKCRIEFANFLSKIQSDPINNKQIIESYKSDAIIFNNSLFLVKKGQTDNSIATDWSKENTLNLILEAQDKYMNPKNIFGDFRNLSIDLHSVFPNSKKNFSERGSSENWTIHNKNENEQITNTTNFQKNLIHEFDNAVTK